MSDRYDEPYDRFGEPAAEWSAALDPDPTTITGEARTVVTEAEHPVLGGAEMDRDVVARIREVPEEPAPIRSYERRPLVDRFLVPLLFAIAYGVIGYFVISNGRVVSFDGLARLNEAYMALWNSPPRLAAVSLNTAPLGALAYLPLAIIKPLATSLVAMPVLTAIAGGITIGAVNAILWRCEVPTVLRYVLLVLFGLNPLFVQYAGNGEPVMLGLAAAALAVYGLVSWGATSETRHLVVAGLMIAVATMVDYGYALWAVAFVLVMLFAASGRGESTERMRSGLLLFLAPLVYFLGVWIFLNQILVGSPFGWLTAQLGPIQVNTTGALKGVTSSLGGSLSDLLRVVIGIAPLAILSAVLLGMLGLFNRSRFALGLLVALLVAAAVPVIRALVANQADLVNLAAGLPLAVLAVGGAAYVHRRSPGLRGPAALALGVGLILALPLGWVAMKNYRFQDQSQAFTRYISSGNSQEGTASVGGFTVGFDPELAMARHIVNDLGAGKNGVLVDDNFSYGVMLATGQPRLFLDRADRGEDRWQSVVNNPWGKVGYMLISTERPGDQLRKAHPDAITGGEAGLVPVFRTDRYVLLQVAETRPDSSERANADEAAPGPQSSPRPVTPRRPSVPSRDSSAAPPVQVVPDAGDSDGSSDAGVDSGSTPSGIPLPSGGSSAPRMEGE